MIVSSIKLKNYRRFLDIDINFNSRFNIVIGKNGAGKTTILDAVATMLGTWFHGSNLPVHAGNIKSDDRRFTLKEVGGEVFKDIEDEVYLEASCTVSDQHIIWRRDYGDRGKNAREYITHGNTIRASIKSDVTSPLPVLLYYGAGRLWKQHRNLSTKGPSRQIDAYKFCLDPLSDQRSFERWFKKMTQSGLQKHKEFSPTAVIEEAVICCIPGAQKFYFDIDLDEVVVELEQEGLVPLNSLSDGFRNMIAMIADIAHRAFRLNPHLEANAARESYGVVLIDEIDLHLHPKWQRRVVDNLQTAFPNLQFIVTTHSPFILQSAKNNEVIDISANDERKYADDMRQDLLGPQGENVGPVPDETVENRSIEDIAELIMGIEMPQRSERAQKMHKAAIEYYSLLASHPHATQKQKDELKERLDRLSAPFSENIAYHAYLQTKRIAAGVTSKEEEEE
ncbi:AAA family ATPase [Asaia spathodeae]|uniref:AAA family ATPase n=1 Tax=Asaia spathodeae TaxID=657016 RepID=UPI002FC33030